MTRSLAPQTPAGLAGVNEIVVPHDGSELAARALRVADLLAGRVGARVARLTVVRPGDPDEASDRGVIPGVGVARVITARDPAEAIADYLTSEPDRMLCMSTHGRGRLRAGLRGSVAEELIQRTAGPMLLVGPSARWETDEFRRIVACVDGSEHSETILPVAAGWARDLDVRLDLVQVLEPLAGWGDGPVASGDVAESSYVHALARGLVYEGVSPEWEVLRGKEPAGPLCSYAARIPGSLIAISTHGRTGWSRIVMGSVAMRLVQESPVPLLVMRPPTLER
jgi:nucleotide-binding universal stress UspA family protein